jgi:hypothetical protein
MVILLSRNSDFLKAAFMSPILSNLPPSKVQRQVKQLAVIKIEHNETLSNVFRLKLIDPESREH